jgi:circadian clock protein KaiB
MKTKSKIFFRLYVAGESPNSILAIGNLGKLCREHFAGCFELEVVDLLRDPERALKDRVLLTPTLIKFYPKPVRKIIGNLNDETGVLRALGLETFKNEK